MKRKLEAGGDQSFFKKLKTSGDLDQDLRQKLILAALKYDGKLKHIQVVGIMSLMHFTIPKQMILY